MVETITHVYFGLVATTKALKFGGGGRLRVQTLPLTNYHRKQFYLKNPYGRAMHPFDPTVIQYPSAHP